MTGLIIAVLKAQNARLSPIGLASYHDWNALESVNA